MRNVDSAYLRQLARMSYKAAYEFRLVTQDGKAYPIPSRAVLSAPASAAVDGGTWEMPVSIMRSQMPKGVDPKQYHRLEVDRVVAGNRMPYFRGIIDEVTKGDAVENGSEIETMNLQAFGVLQKAKGYRVDSLRIDPVTQDGARRLRGLGKYKTWAPGMGVIFGMTETIPYQGPTLGDVKIYTDDTLATQYVEGTDYDLTPGTPSSVQWTTDPAITRVFVYDTVERFAILNNTYSGATFLTLPPGRDYDDLFHTYVTDFTTTTITTPFTMEVVDKIRVADKTGYDGILNIGADDFVYITKPDGTLVTGNLAGYADSNGWIQLVTAFGFHLYPSDVDAGYPVRLPTTEAIAAWDDDRLYQFWDGLGGAASANEWNRTLLTPYPSLGLAIPTPHLWSSSDQVWIDSFLPDGVGYIREDVDANRVEEVVKTILTTETGLFAAGDVETGITGAFVKNRTWSGYDLADVLTEFKDQALPPHAFIHDTQDGKVTIKAYSQKTEPDWVLRGIQSIEETDVPEPITAVTVIAEASEPVNLAGEWLYLVDGADNPGRLTDTIKGESLSTTASAGQDGFTAVFKVPLPEPGTVHPIIDSIRITGTGLVTAYFTPDFSASGPTYLIPGCNFAPIKSGTLEITSDQIARVVTADAGYLVIWIARITSGNLESSTVVTAASCSEIEILTKKAGWWRAALTDDTNLAPANNGPDEFGTIWRQPDPTKRQSYRHAPTEYLKRVQVLYPSAKAREKVLPMTAISQQDTRDYSERHADEYLRQGKRYRVVAPYDDRWQEGDTVLVAWKGFRKNLFAWGITGPQNPRDPMADYTSSTTDSSPRPSAGGSSLEAPWQPNPASR